MPKLRHYDDLGTARFVTFSCYRKMEFLADANARSLLIMQIDMARFKHGFKLWGYVIMPDHVHLVIMPPKNMKLGLVIREIKSKMAREYFAQASPNVGVTRVFWQKRCYDHNCRSAGTVREKIIYCHNNPVKRGLVRHPGEYRWSSYNWYAGQRDVPLALDEFQL